MIDRRPPLDALTPREHEIALLVGQGLTNPQIGLRLGISPNTVHGHTRQIYDKLGARNRVDVVMWAARQGYVRWTPGKRERPT